MPEKKSQSPIESLIESAFSYPLPADSHDDTEFYETVKDGMTGLAGTAALKVEPSLPFVAQKAIVRGCQQLAIEITETIAAHRTELDKRSEGGKRPAPRGRGGSSKKQTASK